MTKLFIKFFIKNNKEINNPKVREKYGLMGSFVGICVNILLSLTKLIAGLTTSSIAIMSDAINNLSDAFSSIVSLVGFKMANKPADDDHPFGHGRAEYVSGLIVSMAIILMGFEIFKNSISKIINPQETVFSTIPFIIMIASILVKLWLFFFYKKIAKIIDSTTLKATAIDSISDVIATSTVVICMFISYLTPLNLDAYAGLIVSLFVIYAGYQTAIDTLNPLIGQAPDPEFVKSIEEKVLSYPQILGIHDLIIHNYGPNNSIISLHAEVPCNCDILITHDTIDLIERDLKNEFKCETVIHMDPIVTDDKITNEVKNKICVLVKLIDKNITIHDFRMVEGTTHTNLIFDIVIPHKFRLTDKEVIELVDSAVKSLNSSYNTVITVDKVSF